MKIFTIIIVIISWIVVVLIGCLFLFNKSAKTYEADIKNDTVTQVDDKPVKEYNTYTYHFSNGSTLYSDTKLTPEEIAAQLKQIQNRREKFSHYNFFVQDDGVLIPVIDARADIDYTSPETYLRSQ